MSDDTSFAAYLIALSHQWPFWLAVVFGIAAVFGRADKVARAVRVAGEVDPQGRIAKLEDELEALRAELRYYADNDLVFSDRARAALNNSLTSARTQSDVAATQMLLDAARDSNDAGLRLLAEAEGALDELFNAVALDIGPRTNPEQMNAALRRADAFLGDRVRARTALRTPPVAAEPGAGARIAELTAEAVGRADDAQWLRGELDARNAALAQMREALEQVDSDIWTAPQDAFNMSPRAYCLYCQTPQGYPHGEKCKLGALACNAGRALSTSAATRAAERWTAMRTALEFYSDPANWTDREVHIQHPLKPAGVAMMTRFTSPAMLDGGAKATAALAETK
jgi:hypothetical protein